MEKHISVHSPGRWTTLRSVIAITLSIGLALLYTQTKAEIASPIYPSLHKSPFQHKQYSKGLQKCRERFIFPSRINAEAREFNPRLNLYLNSTTKPKDFSTVIQNSLLLNGDGNVEQNLKDIYIANGLIYGIADAGSEESLKYNVSINPSRVIDAKGLYVTPGLVETHSHVGICTQPELRGVNDMFELMSPTTPFTRTLDAFNVGDPAIKLISFGGVTSALVLPSANTVSGEGFVFKMLVPPSVSAEQMLVQYDPNDTSPNTSINRQRYIKLACGENPKRRFKSLTSAPKTRMGSAYLFRSLFARATSLKEEQDNWCDKLEQGVDLNGKPFPESTELELPVALLRGKVRSNSHCYETYDIETLLRQAREFHFNITAIHHALDAYKIPDIIKQQDNKIAIATFSTEWGFKKEAFQGSVFSPKILDDNGIEVVFHSDHPANGGQDLIIQAQFGHNFGLPADKAFAGVTGNSAKVLGLDDRIGYIKKGYDADVVIWDRHPLQMGSSPLKVFIDGVSVLDAPLNVTHQRQSCPESLKPITTTEQKLESLKGLTTFIIRGIEKSYLNGFNVEKTGTNELLVQNGTITCFSKNCTISNVPVLKLHHGYLSPGATALTITHGLVEMPSEPETGDGDILDSGILNDFNDPHNVLFAKDGLQLESAHLERAHNSGTLRVITPPFRNEGHKFLTGVSAAFETDITNLENITKSEVALHLTIGDMGKQTILPTISSQISELRKLLVDNRMKDNIYGRALRGEIPLALHTNNKYVMLQLINLKKELVTPKMIFIGAIESHLIADDLAQNDISVVLSPWRCQRKFWDERRCLTGLHGTPTVVSVLKEHGVKFGIAVDDDKLVKFLFQEAGIAASRSIISPQEAIDSISTNIDDIFGLPHQNGFLVTEGSPVEFGSRIGAIVENGKLVNVFPELEPKFEIAQNY